MSTRKGVRCGGCGIVKAKVSVHVTFDKGLRCTSCCKSLESKKQRLAL